MSPFQTHAALARLRWLDARAGLPTASKFAIDVAWRVAIWAERRRSRRALAELSDMQLRDIGLTRDQADREAEKPFWR